MEFFPRGLRKAVQISVGLVQTYIYVAGDDHLRSSDVTSFGRAKRVGGRNLELIARPERPNFRTLKKVWETPA